MCIRVRFAPLGDEVVYYKRALAPLVEWTASELLLGRNPIPPFVPHLNRGGVKSFDRSKNGPRVR